MSNIANLKNGNDNIVVSVNPANGELIAEYEVSSKQQAEKQIEKAHEAFLSWRNVDISERAQVAKRIGELLEENKEELAQMMTKEMGKMIGQARGEVDGCVKICEYNAENGPDHIADEKREMDGGYALITYQPTGVLLAMQPWNFPLSQIIRFAIPNLIAGNSIALKHSEIVWGTAKIVERIFYEAGLPKDLFQLLLVGNEIVDELIEHEHVRGVTLTGSAKAGTIVGEIAGKNLKKTVLELGGSDPYIILDDADLELAVKICVRGRTANNGQICVAAKRFIATAGIYDEFREKFIEAMKNVKYGDPLDENNNMGPLAKADLRQSLQKQVQESIDKGAKCIIGGEIPEGVGNYYPATILENVSPGMPAYDDELFGPVAVLFKAEDLDDAVRIANDHRYGLGGGIFSKNEEKAIEIARTRIDTGMVNVNGFSLSQPHLPFGGVRDSGYGREHGEFGIKEFVNIKTVTITQN